MKLSDDFMKHFRWLTPVLLAFNIFIAKEIYFEFKAMKATVSNLQIDMAMVKTFLTKKLQ